MGLKNNEPNVGEDVVNETVGNEGEKEVKPEDTQVDYQKIINEAVAKALAEQMKQFQPQKQDVKHEEPVAKTIQPIDYEAKFAEMEKRLSDKYEKNSYIASLSQEDLTYLKSIDGFENMSIKAMKQIMSRNNVNPDITITNKAAQGNDLNDIINKLRPSK